MTKIFEDYPDVSCNECAEYWSDTCDGTPKGSTRLCNSFKATRSVILPAKLERLERRLDWLIRVSAVTAVGMVILILALTL